MRTSVFAAVVFIFTSPICAQEGAETRQVSNFPEVCVQLHSSFYGFNAPGWTQVNGTSVYVFERFCQHPNGILTSSRVGVEFHFSQLEKNFLRPDIEGKTMLLSMQDGREYRLEVRCDWNVNGHPCNVAYRWVAHDTSLIFPKKSVEYDDWDVINKKKEEVEPQGSPEQKIWDPMDIPMERGPALPAPFKLEDELPKQRTSSPKFIPVRPRRRYAPSEKELNISA